MSDRSGVTPLHPKHIIPLWEKLEPLFLGGKEHWEDYYELEDIKRELLRGHLTAWVYIKNKDILCVLVVCITAYPKRNVLRYVYAYGKGLRACLHHVYSIENWAREHGADRYELAGRFPWERYLSHLKQFQSKKNKSCKRWLFLTGEFDKEALQ